MISFLSKERTLALRGLLALMVLICHLHGRVKLFSNSILGTLFTAFGYLAVSVFFFLSGYGLTENYEKDNHAINKFHKTKIFPFFLICCIAILIYTLRDLLSGSFDLVVFIQSFFIGKTIVDYGWYLQTQLLLYILFYIAFGFVTKRKLLSISLFVLVYVIACYCFKLSSTWYESVICFVLGVVVSQYKCKFVNFLNKKRTILLSSICVFILFIVTLYFGNKAILSYPIRVIVKMISSVSFTLLVVMFIAIIKVDNAITTFLGKISLEIYILQGLILNIYKNVIIISNDWIYIVVTMVSVVVVSFVAHPVFAKINRIGKVKNKILKG